MSTELSAAHVLRLSAELGAAHVKICNKLSAARVLILSAMLGAGHLFATLSAAYYFNELLMLCFFSDTMEAWPGAGTPQGKWQLDTITIIKIIQNSKDPHLAPLSINKTL